MAKGTPEQVARAKKSVTGGYLAPLLNGAKAAVRGV
jgi:excinuclease UvrABC ATPase subunit